ncbi:hypothetical protein WUBG_19202, partial [Wuchereria bancrofti]
GNNVIIEADSREKTSSSHSNSKSEKIGQFGSEQTSMPSDSSNEWNLNTDRNENFTV